jgi:hypothetical protein
MCRKKLYIYRTLYRLPLRTWNVSSVDKGYTTDEEADTEKDDGAYPRSSPNRAKQGLE